MAPPPTPRRPARRPEREPIISGGRYVERFDLGWREGGDGSGEDRLGSNSSSICFRSGTVGPTTIIVHPINRFNIALSRLRETRTPIGEQQRAERVMREASWTIVWTVGDERIEDVDGEDVVPEVA